MKRLINYGFFFSISAESSSSGLASLFRTSISSCYEVDFFGLGDLDFLFVLRFIVYSPSDVYYYSLFRAP